MENKAQQNRHPAVQVTALAKQHDLAKAGGCFALGWTARWKPSEFAVKVALLSPPAATLAMALAAKKALELEGYLVRDVKKCGTDAHAFEIHFSVASPKPKTPSAVNICRPDLWERLGRATRSMTVPVMSSSTVSVETQEVA